MVYERQYISKRGEADFRNFLTKLGLHRFTPSKRIIVTPNGKARDAAGVDYWVGQLPVEVKTKAIGNGNGFVKKVGEASIAVSNFTDNELKQLREKDGWVYIVIYKEKPGGNYRKHGVILAPWLFLERVMQTRHRKSVGLGNFLPEHNGAWQSLFMPSNCNSANTPIVKAFSATVVARMLDAIRDVIGDNRFAALANIYYEKEQFALEACGIAVSEVDR